MYPTLEGMRERDARRRAVSPELLIKQSLVTQESNTLLGMVADRRQPENNLTDLCQRCRQLRKIS